MYKANKIQAKNHNEFNSIYKKLIKKESFAIAVPVSH